MPPKGGTSKALAVPVTKYVGAAVDGEGPGRSHLLRGLISIWTVQEGLSQATLSEGAER